MNLRGVLENQIFRGGTVFFIGGVISNILNYLYRILMGKMLGPEDFGELIAIISLILILVVPSAPLQTVAARFSAVFETQDFERKIKNLFFYLTRIISLLSFGLIILAVIFANEIQNFLKLSSKNYVYFLAATIAIMLVTGITKGILQGLKRFSKLSYAIVFESVGRVLFAVIPVSFGFKMAGALSGFLIPLILVYFLTIYYLRDILKLKVNERETEKGEIKEIWQYVFYSFLAFLFLNILLNVDKILVKHYFSAFEAGIFSGFTTLAQAVFIVVSLLAGIMFPVVASKQVKKEDYFHSFKIFSLISLLVTILGCLILFLFPGELLLIFLGNQYLEGVPFLGYYGIVMGICGFIFLFSSFFMALNKFKFLYILAIGSILEIFLITLWHSNFFQIISMFSIALIFTFFSLGFLIFLEKRNIKYA